MVAAPAPIVEPLKRKPQALNKKKPKTYASPKHPHAARAPDDSVMTRGTYKYGDGDTILPHRPGSLDFLKWPSVGNSC